MIDRNLVPIYEEDGSIRYWYDRDTGLYYGPDKTTVIDDPYLTVDPGTGWTIIRDLHDRVIGYYDPKMAITTIRIVKRCHILISTHRPAGRLFEMKMAM